MMVEFVDEVVSVEVQLGQEGTVRPLAFVWRGRRYRIESWGRVRTETRDEGAVRCHLVQTAGAETWELCQEMEMARWRLARRWGGRYGIV